MYRAVASAIVSILLAGTAAPADKRVALVVGNNLYPNLPADQQLRSATNDTLPPQQPVPVLPPTITAGDIIGRWGLAAFYREEDRARTEIAARGQCRRPYTISRGARGGIMMHLADHAQPSELNVKVGPNGDFYIGLGEDPAGSPRDHRIISFDGRMLVARFVDEEVAERYGTRVYLRCDG
jgi:hypothetical protein